MLRRSLFHALTAIAVGLLSPIRSASAHLRLRPPERPRRTTLPKHLDATGYDIGIQFVSPESFTSTADCERLRGLRIRYVRVVGSLVEYDQKVAGYLFGQVLEPMRVDGTEFMCDDPDIAALVGVRRDHEARAAK